MAEGDRYEDVVVVTDNGYENFTDFLRLDQIERVMREEAER